MLGFILMLISAILITGNLFLAKIIFLNSSVSAFDLIYISWLVSSFWNFIIIKAGKIDIFEFPSDMMTTIILRILTGFLAFFCAHYALSLISLSLFQVIFWINPFFVSLFSYLILGESIHYVDIIGMIIAFIGVILCVNPFSINFKGDNFVLGVIVAFIGAIGGGLSPIYQRKMSQAGHFMLNPTYFGIGCMVLVSPICMADRAISDEINEPIPIVALISLFAYGTILTLV